MPRGPSFGVCAPRCSHLATPCIWFNERRGGGEEGVGALIAWKAGFT